MNRSFTLFSIVFLAFVFTIQAQNKRKIIIKNKQPNAVQMPARPNVAIVVDERLAVLRMQPSFYSDSIQRMRMGRVLAISGAKEVEGVTFYRVIVPPKNYGWVQADAVVSKNRAGDDEKLVRLIQATDGFDQIERAVVFLENFPNSQLRPAILLLLGDLAEEATIKLSKDANRQLDRREMAANGAPLNSFYLNYVSLDRYRKLGINYWFNSATKNFHYNGTTWREIVDKFHKSNEAVEAKRRLDSLNEKMAAKGVVKK